MRSEEVDSELFARNRARLAELLGPGSMVVVHANDTMPTNADGVLPFVQNRDLYYLSGVDQEETVVILFPDAEEEKDREILFVRETSELISIWEGEKLTKGQAVGVSGIKQVNWTNSFEAHFHRLMPQARSVYLATNEHLRAEVVVETRNVRFIRECQARYPLHDYQRLAPLMDQIRVIKDAEEIKQLQKAIDLTEAGFRRALGFIKPGVGEWEIEAEYLHEFVRNRSKGFAYPPIVGSGKNACVLHYVENNTICQDGEMVLMDVGAEWANWNADMTRTVPVNGRFTNRQRDVYNSVLKVQRGSADFLRPGVTQQEWRDHTIELMEAELISLGLISAEEAKEQDPEDRHLVKKYYMHGIGHHLGLDVHDVGNAYEPVKEGMVFTVEPGIYIREESLGVRLEDNILIGRDGNKNLFENFPVEVEEIEEAMNP
ncbi:MAG: aminopeptidase P family protein [Roseibacillus sp.]|jgi:Xaa-Pro aminopeptidase|nr:aminopeptidase P family protein [Roseibacillus sp.]